MNTKQKTVKCVYGNTHVILQRHFDNKEKTLIPLIKTDSMVAPEPGDSLGCLHRENIILDDTIGFQIVNPKGDYWKHEANDIIRLPNDAAEKLCEAIHKDPDGQWKYVQVAKNTIENPSYI